MPADLSSIEAVFSQAMEIPEPEARAAYLDRACAGDPELRRQVLSLIEAHNHAGGFLGSPTASFEHGSPEPVGSTVGPYKLLEPIGEGGMGAVYMAEQQKPVRRKVALKIIKPGMDTKQVIARFEAERQALALMDHPNIARVLDAGATDSGRPYFVMELVKGLPVTEYCDRNHMAVADRLELFTQVCQAVQHAHQKGIIHRDLKPSNVLVTQIDGAAVPKVIDFGVAKAMGQQLTERTLVTGFAQLVGTPLYMSPEQAEFSGVDVDTRSDIYSLGVLLYELLTGTTPFDAATFRAAAYDEIRRIIREVEPPRPSTRLSSLEATATTISANRQSDPRVLGKSMRGELDWIVMKALEKDRNRRYETASGLAADVRRYLDDEPVQACPPSAWYRFGKLARRHRAALATSTLVATALMLGTAVSTWQAIRATRAEQATREQRDAATSAQKAESQARKRAEDAEASARAEAEKARTVNDFLTKDLLNQAERENTRGEDKITLLEVIDRAAEKIGERFRAQPEAEVALRLTLFETYKGLEVFAKAKSQAQAAVDIERRLHGPEAAETFYALAKLAHMRVILERSDEALESERQATEGLRRTRGPDHYDTIVSLENLSEGYFATGRTEEAISLLEEIIELRTSRYGPDFDGVISVRNDLAEMYRKVGRLAEAIRLGEETVRRATAKFGRGHYWTLVGCNNLGLAYQESGRKGEAINLYEENLKLEIAKFGPDHQNLYTRNNLGTAYYDAGRYVEAAKQLEENLKASIKKLGADDGFTRAVRNNLAHCYQSLGRWAEAESLRRDELARVRKTAPFDSARLDRDPADGALAELGINLLSQAKYAEAEQVLRECLAIREVKIPDHWRRYSAMCGLGGALLGQAKYAEAEPLLVQGYEGFKARETKMSSLEKTRTTQLMRQAGERVVALYEAWGRPEMAVAWRAKLPPASAGLPEDVFARP
jgi:serine/threonine protein kinase